MKRRFILIGISSLCHPVCEGTNYYVRTGGCDDSTGTSIQAAWQTIARVNSVQFAAGDHIFFEGGSVFSGNLYFDANDGGTCSDPLVITSYNLSAGRAVINGGNSFGLFCYNRAGMRIVNIDFTGSGMLSNTNSGILFHLDLGPGWTAECIVIDSVEVSGFQKCGISIGSGNGTSGFSQVTISQCTVRNNGEAGIFSYGESVISNFNWIVRYNKVFSNTGRSSVTDRNTGNGIVLSAIDSVIIEHCEAWDNGSQNGCLTEGPVGIWVYMCNRVYMQFNESHHNRTGTTKDGGGFDFDGGTSNSFMQYNYSHHNDGPGFLLAQYSGCPRALSNAVIRYNISEDDARKNGDGAIHIWSSGASGGITDCQVYNNSIFLQKPPNGSLPCGIYVASGGNTISNLRFRNNILYTTDSLILVKTAGITEMLFQGNCYWPGEGWFTVSWGGTSYHTLQDWRTTGQELLNSVETGSCADPLFLDPGNGGTISNTDSLFALNAYRLSPSSPAINTGLDLQSLFGTVPGIRDFYGDLLSIDTLFCIGAHEVNLLPVSVSIIATPSGPVCSGMVVSFQAFPVNCGQAPVFQWQVNTQNAGTNSSTYSYAPASGDEVICILTSSELYTSGNPDTSNLLEMEVYPSPAVSLNLCVPVTSRDAKPFPLRGGLPLGGIYKGPGVQGGFFYPSLVPAGQTNVNIQYAYANVFGCSDSSSRQMTLFPFSNHLCGDPFTDIRDNFSYPTVFLGTRCWMAASLNYGFEIPADVPQRDNCIPEKYLFPTSPFPLFSSLYQWDELMQYSESDTVQGLCPPGWHVPDWAEWDALIQLFQDAAHAGTSLKTGGSSGFNALPEGFGIQNTCWLYGSNDSTLHSTLFWTSTARGPEKAWAHGLNTVVTEPTFTPSVSSYPSIRINAFSVRCVKD